MRPRRIAQRKKESPISVAPPPTLPTPVCSTVAPVVDDEPFVVVDAPTEEPPAAAEEAPAAVQSEAELSALTVPALKDLCRAAGLKVGGKKAELVERIMRGSN